MKESQFTVSEDAKERTEEMEEAWEVKNIGPKKDAPRRARPEREAEEPLKRGGVGTTPEPARVPNLGCSWEEDAHENNDGD